MVDEGRVRTVLDRLVEHFGEGTLVDERADKERRAIVFRVQRHAALLHEIVIPESYLAEPDFKFEVTARLAQVLRLAGSLTMVVTSRWGSIVGTAP